MAFKPLLPRKGTVIPPHHRQEPTSINNALHELPAYREYTHDLVGVVLYLPRTRWVVVPFRADGGCQIVHGDETYRRTGYHVMITEWELQRALRVVLDLRPVDSFPDVAPDVPGVMIAECADGTMVKVYREKPVVIEPEPGAFGEPADPETQSTDDTEEKTP